MAERARQPLAIALVDLDHFKQINDRYGHPAGDPCLQRAAQAFAAVVQRSGDVLARYGGEEFIVMMPNTDLAGAQVIAERLLAAVRAVDLVVDGVTVPVTCSIGVASVIPDRSTKSSVLIKAADDALYEANTAGAIAWRRRSRRPSSCQPHSDIHGAAATISLKSLRPSLPPRPA